MPAPFGTAPTITGPAIGAFAITPGTAELPQYIRQLTIGTEGIVAFTSSVDERDYTTGTLPPGNYAVFASHILPATTAGGLTGWV